MKEIIASTKDYNISVYNDTTAATKNTTNKDSIDMMDKLFALVGGGGVKNIVFTDKKLNDYLMDTATGDDSIMMRDAIYPSRVVANMITHIEERLNRRVSKIGIEYYDEEMKPSITSIDFV